MIGLFSSLDGIRGLIINFFVFGWFGKLIVLSFDNETELNFFQLIFSSTLWSLDGLFYLFAFGTVGVGLLLSIISHLLRVPIEHKIHKIEEENEAIKKFFILRTTNGDDGYNTRENSEGLQKFGTETMATEDAHIS